MSCRSPHLRSWFSALGQAALPDPRYCRRLGSISVADFELASSCTLRLPIGLFSWPCQCFGRHLRNWKALIHSWMSWASLVLIVSFLFSPPLSQMPCSIIWNYQMQLSRSTYHRVHSRATVCQSWRPPSPCSVSISHWFLHKAHIDCCSRDD